MARCLNCIHFDVCNHDRREYEETFGQCREFLNEDDVVQKSEVEMLQGALKAEERHNELTMEMAKKALANAKSEVAREIFEEIEKIATAEGAYDYVSIQEIAELKKKYTEQAVENAERCVICGEVIPEGRQACPKCEKTTPK